MQNQEIYHQTSAMMTVGLNEFVIAIDDSILISGLRSYTSDTEEFFLSYGQYVSIVAIDIYICRTFGTVMAAILIDKVGRKSLLSFSAAAFCLAWLLMFFANLAWVIFVAHIILGIARGINDVTSAVYLGENSLPSTRGILGTLIKSIYSLGYLIGFLTAMFFHYKMIVVINFFTTLLSLISTFWMVEPAQYLIMKGKLDQAKKNFIWLKGVEDLEEATQEFEKIKQNVNAETSKKSSFFKSFTYPANYKSLMMMLTIFLILGLINYNVSGLIDLVFITNFDKVSTWNIFLVLIGVTQFLVMASTLFFIRRFNRRSVIMISFLLISITLFLIALLIVTVKKSLMPSNIFVIFIHISILFLKSVYAFTFAILFLLRSEIFPLSMKGIGGSLSIIGYTLGGFLMIQIVAPTFENFEFITFLVSGFSVILVLFLYYVELPETGNKSLIEIQERLEGEN